jgi:fumarate reductase subunit D
MAKRPLEPLLWMLFSAGGVAAALVLPILVLLWGLAFPLGWATPPEHARLLAALRHPLTRAACALFCTLALVHGAHRFRYTLYDGLQVKHLNELITLGCYGGALAGSVWATYLLWQIR